LKIFSLFRRHLGLVYGRCEFQVELTSAEFVDFWACDALALSFADNAFAGAVSMKMLDCVASPADFSGAMAKSLASGTPAAMACPYDGSLEATPVECWLGGHSQRGPEGGNSDPVLLHLPNQGASQAMRGLHFLSA